EFKILDSVINVNAKQKTALIPKIKNYFQNDLNGKRIGIWGLAFKPETDDIREAPALYIIEDLLKAGASVIAFDPEAMPNVKRKFGDKIDFATNMYQSTEDVDALVICTEWSIFRTPNFSILKDKMKNQVIFDGRNLYDTEDMAGHGFYYSSIGRKTVE
ncbi:MAG: UDP binding domain-containing protein, partial [Flavobacteriaceae bacterium]|nr:UDP binding domain-containing protein [Flavobacteriaceae bacterium]